jgi:hypothetical protein
VGSSVTVTVTCKFAPGSKITITLNGNSYSTAIAPGTGIFIETLTATKPRNIALNGGPAVPTTFGAVNTFVATGTNPGGGKNVASTCVVVLSSPPYFPSKPHHYHPYPHGHNPGRPGQHHS